MRRRAPRSAVYAAPAGGAVIDSFESSLWLESDDPGITLDVDDKLTLWPDMNDGHDASQGNALLRPTLVADQLNGLPVVRFGATLKMGFTAFAGGQNTKFQAFVVYKHTGTTGVKVIFSDAALAGWQLGVGATNHKPYMYNPAVGIGQKDYPTVLSAGWHLLTFGLSVVDNKVYMSVDGGAEVAIAMTTTNNPAAVSWDELSHGTAAMDGDLAALRLFSRRLLPSQFHRMTEYFSEKYGL